MFLVRSHEWYKIDFFITNKMISLMISHSISITHSNIPAMCSNYFQTLHYQCSIQAQCTTTNLTHSLFKSWSSSHTLLLQINLICIPIKSARLKSYIVWFACEQQTFKYVLHMLFGKMCGYYNFKSSNIVVGNKNHLHSLT